MTTTIPKSLHTVTVLVNVGRRMDCGAAPKADPALRAADAIHAAIGVIGYSTVPDDYGLVPKAIAALTREFTKGA